MTDDWHFYLVNLYTEAHLSQQVIHSHDQPRWMHPFIYELNMNMFKHGQTWDILIPSGYD